MKRESACLLLTVAIVACSAPAPRRPPEELVSAAEVKALEASVESLAKQVATLEARVSGKPVPPRAQSPAPGPSVEPLEVYDSKGNQIPPDRVAKPVASPGKTVGKATLITAGGTVRIVSDSRQGAGVALVPSLAASDPKFGFSNDAPIQAYRRSLTQYQSGRYADAIQGFSSFLELYADHVLAGSALFYVGDSYFRQKDYKRAIRELQRVLTSYDRSHHVPDALKRLADAEDALDLDGEAKKHRMLLTSLFPSSPAARGDGKAEEVSPPAKNLAEPLDLPEDIPSEESAAAATPESASPPPKEALPVASGKATAKGSGNAEGASSPGEKRGETQDAGAGETGDQPGEDK